MPSPVFQFVSLQSRVSMSEYALVPGIIVRRVPHAQVLIGSQESTLAGQLALLDALKAGRPSFLDR